MGSKRLVKPWVDLQRLPQNSAEAEELTWVLMEVGELIQWQPTEGFSFILEVLKQTDDEWVLTNLAAGPLESLLAIHPKEGLALVEREIPRNPKLKRILEGVWQNLMPEETWQRLQKLRD
ncbi:MAG TPA: hypothetical protein VHP34_04035 [Alphaproteobacteria bacterium]|nr:hypothetical protein [Alphaproteobacteria bacterium]